MERLETLQIYTAILLATAVAILTTGADVRQEVGSYLMQTFDHQEPDLDGYTTNGWQAPL